MAAERPKCVLSMSFIFIFSDFLLVSVFHSAGIIRVTVCQTLSCCVQNLFPTSSLAAKGVSASLLASNSKLLATSFEGCCVSS